MAQSTPETNPFYLSLDYVKYFLWKNKWRIKDISAQMGVSSQQLGRAIRKPYQYKVAKDNQERTYQWVLRTLTDEERQKFNAGISMLDELNVRNEAEPWNAVADLSKIMDGTLSPSGKLIKRRRSKKQKLDSDDDIKKAKKKGKKKWKAQLHTFSAHDKSGKKKLRVDELMGHALRYILLRDRLKLGDLGEAMGVPYQAMSRLVATPHRWQLREEHLILIESYLLRALQGAELKAFQDGKNLIDWAGFMPEGVSWSDTYSLIAKLSTTPAGTTPTGRAKRPTIKLSAEEAAELERQNGECLNRVRQLISQYNLSKSRISKQMGVNYQTFCLWEKGDYTHFSWLIPKLTAWLERTEGVEGQKFLAKAKRPTRQAPDSLALDEAALAEQHQKQSEELIRAKDCIKKVQQVMLQRQLTPKDVADAVGLKPALAIRWLNCTLSTSVPRITVKMEEWLAKEITPQELEAAKRADEADDCDGLACGTCNSAKDGAWMLLCDACESGYHTYCLRPPLATIPTGAWLCPPCLEGGKRPRSEIRSGELLKKYPPHSPRVGRNYQASVPDFASCPEPVLGIEHKHFIVPQENTSEQVALAPSPNKEPESEPRDAMDESGTEKEMPVLQVGTKFTVIEPDGTKRAVFVKSIHHGFIDISPVLSKSEEEAARRRQAKILSVNQLPTRGLQGRVLYSDVLGAAHTNEAELWSPVWQAGVVAEEVVEEYLKDLRATEMPVSEPHALYALRQSKFDPVRAKEYLLEELTQSKYPPGATPEWSAQDKSLFSQLFFARNGNLRALAKGLTDKSYTDVVVYHYMTFRQTEEFRAWERRTFFKNSSGKIAESAVWRPTENTENEDRQNIQTDSLAQPVQDPLLASKLQQLKGFLSGFVPGQPLVRPKVTRRKPMCRRCKVPKKGHVCPRPGATPPPPSLTTEISAGASPMKSSPPSPDSSASSRRMVSRKQRKRQRSETEEELLSALESLSSDSENSSMSSSSKHKREKKRKKKQKKQQKERKRAERRSHKEEADNEDVEVEVDDDEEYEIKAFSLLPSEGKKSSKAARANEKRHAVDSEHSSSAESSDEDEIEGGNNSSSPETESENEHVIQESYSSEEEASGQSSESENSKNGAETENEISDVSSDKKQRKDIKLKASKYFSRAAKDESSADSSSEDERK